MYCFGDSCASFTGNMMSFMYLIIIVHLFLKYVLPWNENRKSLVVLQDPILNNLPVIKMGSIISLLSMLNVLAFVISWWCIQNQEEKYRIGFSHHLTLANLYLLKTLCMFLCPLRICPKANPLQDDFIHFLSGNKSFQNDLFFSGHFAYAYLVSCLFPSNIVCCILPFFVGTCLILSKTHYTVDLLMAVFMTQTSLRITSRFF